MQLSNPPKKNYMYKSTIFYFLLLGLLSFSFFLFNSSYQETVNYTKATDRTNKVHAYLQELSRQLHNAAIIHPELLRINDSLKTNKFFFADRNSVIAPLSNLRSIVVDSVNVRITNKLHDMILPELYWIINSNVPDSMIHHPTSPHLLKLRSIDSLINAGIIRELFLLDLNNKKLDHAIVREKILMISFIVLTSILLLFAILGVSKQKKETKKKENELEIVFNRINDAVVSVDSEWKYTFLNDSALRTHPMGRKETLGRVIWDVHPEMKGTIFWDKYHEAMITKKVIEVESYYVPMDTWFSVKIYPSDDGLTIFYKDITQKKRADKQLLESIKEVEDYKFALDETSIVAITDHRGAITYVNEHFCKISKYSSEELIGKDHRIINSGFHPKDLIKNLWHTIANGKIWKGELKNKAKDGTVYWVDTTIVPFLNNQGKPYQYIAIRTDITERKANESRLLEMNANLQKHAKELAMSNADLEQFAYVASHDLQEPLRMVTSFLTQLEKKYTNIIDEKGKKYIAFAVDGAKRMRQIILDLLEFSRVGRTEDDKEEVDMNSLIEEIKILFRKQVEESNAVITLDKLPVINNYKSPIRQVFQNIIGNALKYTKDKSGCKIHVSVEDKKNEWQFCISDNGIGIDPEFHNKIFIIFQRLHNKDEFSGTGMGLAITKKIIENQEGKIWVDSEEGKGCNFYFTILKK